LGVVFLCAFVCACVRLCVFFFPTALNVLVPKAAYPTTLKHGPTVLFRVLAVVTLGIHGATGLFRAPAPA
jgi:hypothetical protein